MSGWTEDSKCDLSADGHHLWIAPTTRQVEVAEGITRAQLVRTCAICRRVEET